ncbi:hypothetical protein D477_003608 [Arthrobacter crystallopoietes BAB-32]|uniref:Uncharacterized protein n=1 Tax=Arthrobacter crystallopoietes BAB-32 TaxID=1246476 RepID=N1V2L4_9MICC|nr:hypothetical protein [Arthrobacter crystallopoietes]EMY35590.1 hypothetical protein D477_003608 [Arthrobacter crystallopoietes BAB-32]
MSSAGLIILCLAALVSAPMYFERMRGSGNGVLYTLSAVTVLMLGFAGVLAGLGEGGLGAGVYAFAVAAAAIGGGPVTVSILRLSYNASHPENATDAEDEPVLRGGAWIGVLERTAIASTLLAGWPEGLAVVLAVKGLGRYNELGQAGAAERFILGTFSSVLWASAAAGIAVLAR